ncbi:hypothetical protein C8A03DRAFT_29066 [Achaetomium macrosporum]|uniref:Uncharacterized protein n=1 Tax=Achaetomium macrosporum TaxID=79813 RepID=A0AAN7HEW8_9PEZI|nr:hypothetical protein C8A03DRAFT_29066 [Achaetomium macrosporum]
MDLRGYGLPIHTPYYPHLHGRSGETQPDLRNPDEYEPDHSVRNLSSSDGQLEDMPYWTGSPKKHAHRGSNRDSDNKPREPKKSLFTPRNENPGIDVALRNLHHEVSTSLKMFQAFVQCFESQVEPLQDWAEDYTLDTVWRNKVKDQFREKRDRVKFEGVAARILDNRATVKNAVRNAKALKEACDDKYRMEREIRTAKKALLYCDGIIDLADRAASERLACKQLVTELEEVRCLLERKKHPWIYGEETVDQGGLSQRSKTSTKKGKDEKPKRNEMGSENERFDEAEDGDRTEKQHEPDYSFDNAVAQPPEDAGDNQGEMAGVVD